MLIECCKFLLPSSFCECMLPLLHTIFGPGVGGVDVVGCCDQSTSRMSSCKGKNEHTQCLPGFETSMVGDIMAQ
jgi:hypothetical protein